MNVAPSLVLQCVAYPLTIKLDKGALEDEFSVAMVDFPPCFFVEM